MHSRELPRVLQPQSFLHHPLLLWTAPSMQGARSMGFGKGQTECVGELPPRGYPGGAGGRSAPVGEALTSLLYWST